MALRLDDGIQAAENQFAKRFALERSAQPLWPAEYANDSFESAWAFVREQWTWDENAKSVKQFPDKPYTEEYCYDWWSCQRSGKMLVTEKCRRMVISWAARSMELWFMGLRRTDCLLAGEDLEAAAKHVWRLQHLYDQLLLRHEDWKLPAYTTLRYEGAKKLKSFTLANGSVTDYANGEDSTFRGDGKALITLEEFSSYRYGAQVLAQSKVLVSGEAGTIPGFINIITNTSPNYDWQQVKAGAMEKR